MVSNFLTCKSRLACEIPLYGGHIEDNFEIPIRFLQSRDCTISETCQFPMFHRTQHWMSFLIRWFAGCFICLGNSATCITWNRFAGVEISKCGSSLTLTSVDSVDFLLPLQFWLLEIVLLWVFSLYSADHYIVVWQSLWISALLCLAYNWDEYDSPRSLPKIGANTGFSGCIWGEIEDFYLLKCLFSFKSLVWCSTKLI